MSDLMDEAIASLRRVAPELRDEVARAVMQLAGETPPAVALSDEEKADLDEADAEIGRGEFATDAEVRAIWAKHGL